MDINLKINKSIFNTSYLSYLNDYSHRYNVFYGGGGSGKSHFVFQRMILKALKEKRKILITRKVAASIKDSVWQMAIDTLSFFDVYQYCSPNKTERTIELPNGSILLFKGLDDIEKLKSIVNLTDIVVEEATELLYEDFLQLDIRLRHPTALNQELVLMFNPVSKQNWCYKHWFLNKQEDTKIFHTTYKDNKFLPQKQIEVLENLKAVNETYYKIYCLGEFGSLNKLIFTNFEKRYIPPEEVKGLPISVGSDYGFSIDASTGVTVAYNKATETIYVLDEFYKHGLVTEELAEEYFKHGMNRYNIQADSAEPRLIKELKQKGLNIQAVKKGPDSINYGIYWLQARKIVVAPHCTHTIEELQNYHWIKDKKTGEYLNQAVDGWNHCLDAIRYSCTVWNQRNNLKVLQKGALGLC